jgi:uncharacterized protein YkwD
LPTTAATARPRVPYARRMLAGVMLALCVAAVPSPASADPSDDAGTTVWLVNQSRADNGLPALLPDRELQVIANRQANRMADSGTIFHSSNLGDQLSWGWYGWAENVGYGPSVEWVHTAFMGSAHHAGNILNGSYDYVGVGVAYGSDGNVYVATVFGAW